MNEAHSNAQPPEFSNKDEPYDLTPREVDVLRLVIEGCSGREVAQRLHRSQRTVESHLRSVYRKLGVHNRVGLMHATVELGLIQDRSKGGRPPGGPHQPESKTRAIECLLAIDAQISDAPRETYFTELVRAIREGLGVRWVGISVYLPSERRFEPVASNLCAEISGEGACRCANSPCTQALERGIVAVRDDVMRRFPAWSLGPGVRARSFVGVRLADSFAGAVGTLWVLHDQPMPETETAEIVLRIIARSTAAELALAMTCRALRAEEPEVVGAGEQFEGRP